LTVEKTDTYDFYFNSTDGTWYRVRLYRNAQDTAWVFDLDYYASSDPPTDSVIWTNEETYTESGNSYDGANYGFNFDNNNNEGLDNSVLVWVKKDSLSQGYDLLEYGNTTYIFCDTHDGGNTQNKQKDRAPDDTGDPDPTYSYTSVAVPEFHDILLPFTGLLVLFVIAGRKRRRVHEEHCYENLSEKCGNGVLPSRSANRDHGANNCSERENGR
jgi:hypothetical protein